MKVNLKKIGAIVAGATILASTAAFGALWYGNTKLVDENGAPVAKVVVGEKAAASDGVGAALIASRMMASAYKSVNLKGQVVGTATCTGGTGTGNCPVSDEKATLEITVPGQVAEGTYTINTLIGDFLNRRLLDRVDNSAGGSDVEYPYATSETSENANPFTDNAGNQLSHVAGAKETLYRVTGDMFAPLKTQTLKDDSVAKVYTERQDIWVSGETSVYKEADGVQGQFDLVSYTLKFGGAGNDHGIPVCTTPTSNDYTYCKSTDGNLDYATETHKVYVWFLGEQWVISEMSPPTTTVTSDSLVVNGGYVKLAKEAISGLLNQGESLETDNLKFHLDDLEAHGDTTSAILSVLDANDNILKKDKIAPGETKEFNIQGKTYRVHVYKVAPGYTFGAKWADMAIYAKELTLESGKYLDEDQETNPNWKVALGWKNKDGASDDAGTPGNEAAPDHLRSIILWSDKLDGLTVGGEDEKMGPGAYIPFVEDPVVWKLTYSGLDITNADRDTLKFELSKTGEKRFSESLIDSTTPGGYLNCKVIAPYIEVSSSKTGTPLRVSQVYGYKEADVSGVSAIVSDPTDMNYNELYIALNDLQCGADWSSLKSLYGGIFMRLSSSGAEHYGFAPFDDDTTMDNEFARTLEIEYEDIGDGDTTFFDGGGVIEVKPINVATVAISDDVSDGAAGRYF